MFYIITQEIKKIVIVELSLSSIMGIPYYNAGKENTTEKKALDTIAVKKFRSPLDGSEKALKVTQHIEHEDNRKVRLRDALIYRDQLNAEDKDKNLTHLAEKWGFERKDGTADESRITAIITRQRKTGVRIAAMASEIEAIRTLRQARVVDNAEEYMIFLEQILANLRDLEAEGIVMIDVEEEQTISDKGLSTKTKRIPILTAIKNCHDQIMRLAKMEAEALKDYEGTPANIRFQQDKHIHLHGKEASKEFMEEFNRLRGNNEENSAPDTTLDVNSPS